jgi:hypothetical protein
MRSAAQFKSDIEAATKKVVFGLKKAKLGNTQLIALAMEAFEQSVAQNQAQAEQAAYLFEVYKSCNRWIKLKQGKDKPDSSTGARRAIINAVKQEAYLDLMQYPIVGQALQRHATRKANAGQNRNLPAAIPLHAGFANEGAAYQQLKAQGQFHDPTQPRFAPSGSLLKDQYGDRKVRTTNQKEFSKARFEHNGVWKDFHHFSFEDFWKLAALLGHQYKVLYINKLERLKHMVSVENGVFVKAIDGTPYHMPNQTVGEDLGGGLGAVSSMYACDAYGNFFIGPDFLKVNGKRVQINHSSYAAGHDVICAGMISIKNGVLKAISNNSGHYTPDTNKLTELLRWLESEGVDLRGVLVYDQAQPQQTQVSQASLFINGQYGSLPAFWGQGGARFMAAKV